MRIRFDKCRLFERYAELCSADDLRVVVVAARQIRHACESRSRPKVRPMKAIHPSLGQEVLLPSAISSSIDRSFEASDAGIRSGKR